MEAIREALVALIDERLGELGLVEPTPAPAAAGKGKKGAKPAAAPVEEEEVTLDTLKAKLVELVNAQGKDAAIALLGKFKVKQLSQLKPARYEAVQMAIATELGESGGDDASELFGE